MKLDLRKIAESLSEIEARTLRALDSSSFKGVEEISKESALPIDSVRRAVQWLKEKGLIESSEEKKSQLVLTAMGKASLSNGLPERLFVEALQQAGGKATLAEVKGKSSLNAPELNVAMGIAKRNAWVSVMPDKETMLEFTGLEKQLFEGKYVVEMLLKKISSGKELGKEEKAALSETMHRGLVEEVEKTEEKARLNKQGEEALQLLADVKERTYNIEGAVPKIIIGKRQPYVQFLNQLRRKLVSLGFQEMQERLIVQEFYNFDALFQPQNHPARSWTDTYQLKQPKFGKLPDKKIVERVRAAHENGAGTGSRGWRYKWSEQIASRLMPAAHGTAHSARQLVEGVEVPGKYFTIARCYRPDIVDARHLIEFNHLEGIIIDESLTFRNLLGILKQLAVEIAGARKVKFTSGYFPFTEPSCELYIEHPKIGWMEVAGAGIFRPELTLPLGIKEPVIAWGIGVDRLAMIKLGIEDIRQLFSKDLQWLRESKMVME